MEFGLICPWGQRRSSARCSGAAAERAKLEEEVAGDGVARNKRHRKHKGPKKEGWTKKPKGDETLKTKGDEAMEMLVVDAGWEEKGGKRRKTKQGRVR